MTYRFLRQDGSTCCASDDPSLLCTHCSREFLNRLQTVDPPDPWTPHLAALNSTAPVLRLAQAATLRHAEAHDRSPDPWAHPLAILRAQHAVDRARKVGR
jgi:hypothetical protein